MEFETRKCELCGNEFEINIDNKASNKRRFCSGFCAKSYNGSNTKGNKHTEEWKINMSLRNSGNKNPFYGKIHNQESLLKMSLSSQWGEEKYKYCNLTEKEKEIFDGIMISDGHLTNSRISARFTLGFKYLETIERIIRDMSSLRFSTPYPYKSGTGLNFFTKSGFYRDLLLEYEKWYVDGKKIIPNELKLTPLFFYWWYVCDGFIINNNVYLCTDSFERTYVERISDKIKTLGFRNNITSRNRIRFFKKDSEIFLNWISKNVEIQKEYSYKWNLKK